MALTKDQVSDLNSFIAALVAAEILHKATENQVQEAKMKLNSFLYKLEHEKDGD